MSPPPPPSPLNGAERSCSNRQVGQVSSQILGQGSSSCIPTRRLLFEALLANRYQVQRRSRLQRLNRNGIAPNDRGNRFQIARAVKRRPACQQFVKHGSKRIDIGCRIGVSSAAGGLLRGHVAEAAHDLPGLSKAIRSTEAFGQSEIDNLWRSVGG